ncbi:hypothetical protein [Thermosyntropha sp.]|uniref:hypothetical protein n=1 Tax=Thermosyntropha sp. TaxID=2740820 RepID=UPI0026014F70|nr:hypothetical protein [Thermosyntropha sp.]MBO8158753.1 hypothetical protein [Thermosyntropha sp.]
MDRLIAKADIDFRDKLSASVKCSISKGYERNSLLLFSQLFVTYYTKMIFNLGNAQQLVQNLRSVVNVSVNNLDKSVFNYFESDFMLIDKPVLNPIKTYSGELIEDSNGCPIIITSNSMGDEDHFAPLSVLMLLEFLRKMESNELNEMLANGVYGAEEVYMTGDFSSLQSLHEATKRALQYLELPAEKINELKAEKEENNNKQVKIPFGLNSVLMHFRKVADSFPENDFFRDFFRALEYGCFTAFTIISELNEEFNGNQIDFTPLQNMNVEEAVEFCKLCSSFFLYKLLQNEDNIKFLADLKISVERMENYVHRSLGFSRQDVRRYQRHKEMFSEEPQEYTLELYDDLNSLVLERTADNRLMEASLLSQMLSFAYTKGFMNYFNM